MADGLSELYRDLLTGSYDCVDRIVLNGYFRPEHNAGGFRIWWQNLTGSVDTLDNTHRMRLAGRFSRRVRGWAKANGVPVIDCRAGERKHDLAEEHLKTTQVTRSISDPGEESTGAGTATVAAAGIGQDEQLPAAAVAVRAVALPPAGDGVGGKGCRVVRDTYEDRASIGE
jgi:hypothetical protein